MSFACAHVTPLPFPPLTPLTLKAIPLSPFSPIPAPHLSDELEQRGPVPDDHHRRDADLEVLLDVAALADDGHVLHHRLPIHGDLDLRATPLLRSLGSSLSLSRGWSFGRLGRALVRAGVCLSSYLYKLSGLSERGRTTCHRNESPGETVRVSMFMASRVVLLEIDRSVTVSRREHDESSPA